MHDSSDEFFLSAYFTRGCEESFRALVVRYSSLVWSTAARILGSGPDAEDAAQAAFTALAMKGRKLDASRGLGAWLHRVTVRAALDIRRSDFRRKSREEESVRQQGLQPLGECGLGIDEAVEQLPEKMKQAVVLHYMKGRSVEEIARLSGCTPSAISMRLTRARESMRKRLGVAVGLASLAAAGTSQAGVETTMAAIRILDAARASSGLRLVELARNAMRRFLFAKGANPFAVPQTFL
jgi:RNA polymerase sigma-70 factor (ECF subfamily)